MNTGLLAMVLIGAVGFMGLIITLVLGKNQRSTKPSQQPAEPDEPVPAAPDASIAESAGVRQEIQLRFTIDAEGVSREETVTFHETMTIGRDPQCDVCLPQPYVSRRHLQIVWRNGRLTVKNLTVERTGDYTRLNQQLLPQGAVELKSGDVIEIFTIRLAVRVMYCWR